MISQRSMLRFLPLTLSLLLILSAFATVGGAFAPIAPLSEGGLFLPAEPTDDQQTFAYLGEGDDDEVQGQENGGEEGDSSEPVDVIRNGGFELRDSDPMNGVALEWTAFDNGQAFYGWYDETWPEAVHSDEHAQLMEIYLIQGDFLDRVIAIHQTVEVTPHSTYDLSLQAMMRSDADEGYRDASEFEMSWGVDYSGEANFDNVGDWVAMPLTEQARLGSHNKFPDDKPLFYETITGTVRTTDSPRITLFIRGLKKFPNPTEILFDVDQVSLIGPVGGGGAPPEDEPNLPMSGANLPQYNSVGTVIFGGVVLVLLGISATAGLFLHPRKEI